ncbi:MAG: response regulator [Flavobacteriales bacterium]|nr:response regulator [Flavobacteriales bacterium]
MDLKLLYIDDSREDRELLRTILDTITNSIELREASSGEEGLQLLEADQNIPDILLLDLNMPGMHGLDVLKAIRRDERLKGIPVIVFTVSTASTHITEAFRAGANAVINKPLDLSEYKQVFIDTFHFWQNISRLPSK